MKKLISLLTCCLLICVSFTFFASAEGTTAEVYVSIASKGALTVTYEKVTVSDIDDDGALTVNDALYAAHEAKYQGGAEAGYSYYSTEQYGLSIGTLWGDTSGSFGYYINNASAWSLSDTIEDGDHVYAFVYADATTWSDSYSFFDKNTVTADSGSEITLTLSAAGYDADWNPVTNAVNGATITVDGVATEVKTDENGKATITISDAGKHIISATSADMTLVPPVCIATVNEAVSEPDNSSSESSDIPKAGDDSLNIGFIVLAIASLTVACALSIKTGRNEF